MKRAFIYGEFISKSTTGIAYVNTNLKTALEDLKYFVNIIHEPRSNDYLNYKNIIKKNNHIFEYIKIIFKILYSKKYNISYLTISMSYLGLLKSLLITYILKLKTIDLYLYVHRGDIDSHYRESFFKRILIYLHLLLSSKIILLSKNFIQENAFKQFQKKILIIPNSLSKYDSIHSNEIYQKKLKYFDEKEKKKIIKLIYSANIQSAKGIHEIIEAVKIINEKEKNFSVMLDIFGMKFEEIDTSHKNIDYKGKLSNADRLNIMSKYDLLILCSKTEGLPVTLIECMSIGLPFITTNVGAISDLLVNNYPYIIDTENFNIVKVIDLASKDCMESRNKFKKLIVLNKIMFDCQFKYNIFFNNLKKELIR